MPISYAEPTSIACPSCGKPFDAEIWALVDAGERPDLYDALVHGSLNQVTCPQCGHVSLASGPFLLHDPMLRRVYFAVPGDVDEHVWREYAQTMLYALVGALPEEARLPYLSDVQVSYELAGLRQTLTRRGRRGRPDATARARAEAAAAKSSTTAIESSPLLDWIQSLLAADTPAEFQELVQTHPDLLSENATALLDSLTAEARSTNQPDAVRAIQKVRATLQDMRTADGELLTPITAQDEPLDEDDTEALLAAAAEQLPATESISNVAYQEFLGATSPEDLIDAARSHPVLLEPEADAAIALRAEEALDTGNERLAALIDERRIALADLREELTNEQALLEALGALLAAENEDALARILGEHPALLTAAAQQALMTLAARARASDDEHLAVYAVECRAMLREVRRGLEAI